MKRFINTFFVFAVSMSFSSCKKFLNTKPTDSLTPTEYYDSEAKLVNAMAGIYEKLGSSYLYGDYMFSELDACTDDSYYARSATTTGVAVYNFDFTHDRIRGLWQDSYIGIERANQLIANINIASMDETRRGVILAEAKFLRGYYYFLLVTRFGDLPLRLEPVTSPNNTDLERTSIKDVYAQILKDMKDAESKLPASIAVGHSSRVSKTVAQGILARVCLTMAGYPLNDNSKYAEALDWAKKVKQSDEHSLNTTYNNTLTNSAYGQIFINHSQDIYDIKESMWEVDFKGNNGADGYTETGRVGNTLGITMSSTAFQNDTGYCYGFIKGTGRLYNLYGNGDLRRDWALTNFTYNATTGARTPIAGSTNSYGRDAAKWRRSYELIRPKNKNWTPTNFPLLRYADVLLMMAEAENQVNGPTAVAYDAINMVRRRGYGFSPTAPNVTSDLTPGLSQQAFQKSIEDERSRELCFEALRRQDLIRWGKFVSAMNAVGIDQATYGAGFSYAGMGGKNVSNRHLLYPIPSGEMALNKKMGQNPGW